MGRSSWAPLAVAIACSFVGLREARGQGDAPKKLDELVQKLRGKDEGEREEAAEALGELGADAKDAVPDLIEVLKEYVNDESFRAFGNFGPSRLVKNPKSQKVPVAILTTLGEIGAGLDPVIELLTGKLGDKQVRDGATTALSFLGRSGRPAAPKLREVAKTLKQDDPDDGYTGIAIGASLCQLGEAQASFEVLARAAQHHDTRVGFTALRAIRELTEADPNRKRFLVPIAIALLKEKERVARIVGAELVALLPAKGKSDAIPLLLESLASDDKDLRETVQEVLSEIGQDATPVLEGELEKGTAVTKPLAARALLGMEKESGRAFLLESLKSKDPKERAAAAQAFFETVHTGQGYDNKQVFAAAPVLLAALGDEDRSVRVALVGTLAGSNFYFQTPPPDLKALACLPALERLLKDEEAQARSNSADVLSKLPRCGVAIESLVPDLTAALKDSASGVRRNSIWALAAARTTSAIPLFTALLEDPDREVRWAAAGALGSFGKDAKSAVPALEKAKKSDERGLSKAAADALELIEKP
jgi:HEAT repeat protein